MKKPTAKALRPKVQRFPRGWNQKAIQDVIAYYDNQTEDEELAECEAAMNVNGWSVMLVPTRLVPEIRRMIGRRRAD